MKKESSNHKIQSIKTMLGSKENDFAKWSDLNISTMFVVDDDQDDRLYTEKLLSLHECSDEVISFQSAEDFFHHFENYGLYNGTGYNADSVLLLDIHMPYINGIEILDFIRTHPVTTTMKVIFLTSDQSSEKVYEAYRLQADGYLDKPIDMGQLYTLLAEGKGWSTARH